ncbi:hypothetical protein ACFWAR_27905 [Streptomyces sp. NPDC059917]|uniref:hypothetical protein n=1 Tax=Streptomyces sp. NPDC059917 TaxID=3347002 RepID=UPI0036566B1A
MVADQLEESAPSPEEFGKSFSALILWMRHVNGKTGKAAVGKVTLAGKMGHTGNGHGLAKVFKNAEKRGWLTHVGKVKRADQYQLSIPAVLRDEYEYLEESITGQPLTPAVTQTASVQPSPEGTKKEVGSVEYEAVRAKYSVDRTENQPEKIRAVAQISSMATSERWPRPIANPPEQSEVGSRVPPVSPPDLPTCNPTCLNHLFGDPHESPCSSQ